GVLDVVQVEQDVVAHVEREVDLLDLLAGGGVRRLGRVEGRDVVPEGGAVHLDQGEAQTFGDVLHEGRLAVAGRGDEQQHPHLVGAPAVPGGAELLGEVVADQRGGDLGEPAGAGGRAHAARAARRAAAAP